MKSLIEINTAVEFLIAKYGIDKVAQILSKYTEEDQSIAILDNFMAVVLSSVYGISVTEYYTSQKHSIVEARAIAFHVLNKKLELSIRQIGKIYDLKEPAVHNCIKKIDGIINSEKPHLYKAMLLKILIVNERVDALMKDLNHNSDKNDGKNK